MRVELIPSCTVMTALRARDGSFDGQHRRIKIEHASNGNSLLINGYARVEKADIECENGIINVLNRPLLPPPSIMDGIHLLPQKLSTFVRSVYL